MVKIKVEKKMKFPELVQWVWDNNKFDNFFHSDNDSYVQFDTDGDIVNE